MRISGPSGYKERISRCGGILGLRLVFKLQDLLRNPTLDPQQLTGRSDRVSNDDLAFGSVDMIVERYRLDSLLGMERLRRVMLVVQQARIGTREPMLGMRDTLSHQLMREVGELGCGRKVEVVVQGWM